MYNFSLENQNGDSVSLTGNNAYSIREIDGLYPSSATISTSETALYDGAKFNSSRVNARQMEIALVINRDVEKNRIALYKVIKPKHYIKVNYKNDQRDVYIEGYVSDMNVNFFSQKQEVTISILCPEPYFKEATEIINAIGAIIPNFTFPFAIEKESKIPFSYVDDMREMNVHNAGDVESGLTIEIRANGYVKNPTVFNRETREFFGLVTILQSGDVVYITTSRGKKAVKLFRSGDYINLFNSIKEGSTWLQLATGDNIFTYEADDETTTYMDVRFGYRYLYEGV